MVSASKLGCTLGFGWCTEEWKVRVGVSVLSKARREVGMVGTH